MIVTGNNKYFPFTFTANFQYQYNSLIKKTTDSIYQIDLSNWFNHIIQQDVSAVGRNLPFYPDFRFKDSYRYYLKFDHQVTVENFKDTVEIKNQFGRYIFTVSQPSADVVMLESYFTVPVEQAYPCGAL